jgi:hypothetical protein
MDGWSHRLQPTNGRWSQQGSLKQEGKKERSEQIRFQKILLRLLGPRDILPTEKGMVWFKLRYNAARSTRPPTVPVDQIHYHIYEEEGRQFNFSFLSLCGGSNVLQLANFGFRPLANCGENSGRRIEAGRQRMA